MKLKEIKDSEWAASELDAMKVAKKRKCQWMVELKGWKDCGRPATHIRPGCGLAYCTKHSKRFDATEKLVKL